MFLSFGLKKKSYYVAHVSKIPKQKSLNVSDYISIWRFQFSFCFILFLCYRTMAYFV